MPEEIPQDEAVHAADYKILTPKVVNTAAARPTGAFPKPPKARTSPDAAPGPWKPMPKVPRLTPRPVAGQRK